MSCGCGESKHPLVQCQLGWTSPMLQSRAAACIACPSQKNNVCQPLQIKVTTMVVEGNCPKKRYPNGKHHVTWAGIVWRGVPWLWRVKLWWIMRKDPMKKALPECGCPHRLRSGWEWMVARSKMLVKAATPRRNP
jgi:hypothetical protein